MCAPCVRLSPSAHQDKSTSAVRPRQQKEKKKEAARRRVGASKQGNRSAAQAERRGGGIKRDGGDRTEGKVKESRSEAQREDRMKAHGAMETKQQTKENRRAPTLMGTSSASTPPQNATELKPLSGRQRGANPPAGHSVVQRTSWHHRAIDRQPGICHLHTDL